MELKMDHLGFVGGRLKQAREARGMTGTELAKLLRVERQSVSNYENGKRSPSAHVKNEISKILNFPLEFFSDISEEVNSERPVFYRSMSAATKKARKRVEVENSWLTQLVDISNHYVELPIVRFPSFEVPSDPKRLSDSEIDNLAAKTRRFWDLKDGPISNSVWLLENNGAIVVRKSMYAKTLDGFSRWIEGRPYVVLSSDKCSAARSRFDLAHELGHLILHRNTPEICLKDTATFKLIERQADRFSSAFQFPDTAFSREVKRTNLEFFRVLKKRWRLSIAMMLVRAKELNFIDEKRATALWKSYNRKGWRTNEPFDNEIPIEEPKLVRNSIEVILKNRAATREEILGFMNIYHEDAEACAGLPSNFLNPNAGEIRTFRPRVKEDTGSYISGSRENIIRFPGSNSQEEM